jgi:hypothetical protein
MAEIAWISASCPPEQVNVSRVPSLRVAAASSISALSRLTPPINGLRLRRAAIIDF